MHTCFIHELTHEKSLALLHKSLGNTDSLSTLFSSSYILQYINPVDSTQNTYIDYYSMHRLKTHHWFVLNERGYQYRSLILYSM